METDDTLIASRSRGRPRAEPDDQLSRDEQKAKAIQERMRKDAPNIKVGPVWKDPREIMARRLVPEAFWQGPPTGERGDARKGTIPPALSVLYGPKQKHLQYVNEGWIPVREDDGTHAQAGDGDLLYKRPIEFSKQANAMSSKASQERIRAMDKAAKTDGLVDVDSQVVEDEDGT